MYIKYFKRLLDFIFSLILLIILSPLLLGIWIIIRLSMGNPVLFKQKRPGLNEKIFTIFKFRTMADKFDENGKVLSDDKRVTKIGKFLRVTSLDELPELVNVVRGDMSFVGPRPLLPEYLDLYNSKQRKRHDVRPGLTGFAQVMGRNKLTWKEKFQYDIEYVNKASLFFDIKIVLLTTIMVLKREGVNPDDSKSVEPFNGNN